MSFQLFNLMLGLDMDVLEFPIPRVKTVPELDLIASN
jgi:hypothetical protein